MVIQFRCESTCRVNCAVCFLAIYWPASVSDWCYSCSLHRERKHDIPRPRTASGLGGHYRPLFHKVFTTSMFECVAYYRQMSSWFVWQAAQILLSALSHSCTGGLCGCGSFSCYYAGLHCSYSNAAYSFLQEKVWPYYSVISVWASWG